jgi:hypothetical protein
MDEKAAAEFMSKVGSRVAPLFAVSKDASQMAGLGTPGSIMNPDPRKDEQGVSKIMLEAFDGAVKQWKSAYPYLWGKDGKEIKHRNIFGEHIFPVPGSNMEVVTPFYTNKDEIDPVRQELARLAMHAPYYNPTIGQGETWLKVKMPSKYIKMSRGGQVVSERLTAEQYDKLVQYSAGVGVPGVEKTLYEELDSAVKYFNENKFPDENRKLVIAEIISNYQSAGKRYFLIQKENDIIERLSEGLIERQGALDSNFNVDGAKKENSEELKKQKNIENFPTLIEE